MDVLLMNIIAIAVPVKTLKNIGVACFFSIRNIENKKVNGAGVFLFF